MVGIEIFTGVRRKTAFVGAHTVLGLLFAGVVAKVCRRAADIVNVALEIGEFGKLGDLADKAFVTAAGDHSALMECQCAEVAAAEAAAVMDNGKAHLLYCGNAAERLVHGVIGLGIGKLGDKVKLLCRKRHGRRIYNKIPAVMLLNHRSAAHRIMLCVLDARCIGVKTL